MCIPNLPTPKVVDVTPPDLSITSSITAPLPFHGAQPTADGAIENSDLFKDAAARAWAAIQNGNERAESAFSFNTSRAGSSSTQDLGKQPDRGDRSGHMSLGVPDNAFAVAHTHNRHVNPGPSDDDVAAARKLGKPIYVISTDGLYYINPVNGEAQRVFSNPDWMDHPHRGPYIVDKKAARAYEAQLSKNRQK